MSKVARLDPNKVDHLSNVTDLANSDVAISEPWSCIVQLTGTADLLFHRWNNEAVEEKAKASKGSAAKKSDNVESYIYRDADGLICLPGEYLRMSIVTAAKFKQDPRSPRKSAMDLFKAGVFALTDLAVLNAGVKEWDYLDKRRVVIQRNGITRTRPAFRTPWQAEIQLQVNLPEYIDKLFLQDVIVTAGKLVGIGDFRPTYGRFHMTRFAML